MNWNQITVRQYQAMLPVIEDQNFTELDKLVKVICILTGKPEDEIDSWPLNKLNEYKHLFEHDFKKEVKKRVKVNGRYYRFVWQIERLPAARYIEAKTYSQEGFMPNLHRLMASCVMPQRKVLFWYFDKKYNATDHEKYATDLLDAPFPFVYNACVFFCHVFVKWTETILSYSEKELKGKITKSQMKVLRESFKDIMGGFIPPPLSQITNEQA